MTFKNNRERERERERSVRVRYIMKRVRWRERERERYIRYKVRYRRREGERERELNTKWTRHNTNSCWRQASWLWLTLLYDKERLSVMLWALHSLGNNNIVSQWLPAIYCTCSQMCAVEFMSIKTWKQF